MIERVTQMFGAATGTHVKTVGGETGTQGGSAQAANIPRLSGAFQAVHHDDFA